MNQAFEKPAECPQMKRLTLRRINEMKGAFDVFER